jgi:hypothetical protein
MKKLLTTIAAVLATLNMYAQGTVIFSNLGGTTDKQVWLGSVGGGGTVAPAGTQYDVALYYDPAGTGSADAAFVQIGNSAGRLITAGQFSAGNRTIPASAAGAGGVVDFQVRGWNRAFGTSYETALASGNVGKSTVFKMDTAAGTEQPMSVLGSASYTTGWTGFAIVPEPSAIALGLIGASALLLLRLLK